MSDELYRYYQDELHFIRRLAQEFARKYPAAAARLQLEPDRSADPHVERLIEAFALLTGRVRLKIRDEFPELTDAVLSVVYPHALSPVPSLATVRFEVDPLRPTPPGGVAVPAGSRLNTDKVGDLACEYRTCYPVTLWPVAVEAARLHPPPFPPGLNPPARAAAALRLRLRATGEAGFDKLTFPSLRFHLAGDSTLTAPLYDLLHNHALEVAFSSPDRPGAVATVPAAEAVRPVGFDPAEAVLPYPGNVFPGYRLLTEYFAYPEKFLYADLAGWDRARAALGPARQVEAVVFLDRGHPRLEQVLGADLLRLGCTPAINLFERLTQPIDLKHTRPEYRVNPENGHPTGFEVYAVRRVAAVSAGGGEVEYEPFYHFRHGGGDGRAFWCATRRPGLEPDDRGTDVFLHLVDGGFDPAAGDGETLNVWALCTNRDLPTRLPRVGEEVRFHLRVTVPGVRAPRTVRNPTGSLRPASPRGRYWHLVSHLNLNHLSLTGDEAGTEALKGMLRLYDLNDPAAEPRAAALARDAIDGVLRVSSRRTTGWVGPGELGGFARGLEVGLELDEEKFAGASAVLFASVLDRFFGLYASVNSFTRLVARFRQRAGVLKEFPARAGDRPVG